jgi:hypothetical protein
MPDDIMQSAMQPYLKLVQANLELLTKFSTSPEVVAQAAASAQSLLQQGQESAANLVQSNAFAHLVQGMLKNYTEFLTELGQISMAMLTQGQAAMLRQVQEASEQVVEAASKAGKRGLRQVS